MFFKDLILNLSEINQQLREQSLRAVNSLLTLRNWYFGYYIVEFEQNGNDRAEYGKALLATIAEELRSLRIPNTDERELRRFRQFYLTYTLMGSVVSSDFQIRGLLPPELKIIPELMVKKSIRELITPELNIPDSHYKSLFNRISYTHFVELIRIEDPLKRSFYEMECMKGTWSVKELKRQIGSLLYERVGLSADKKKLLAMVQENPASQSPADIIKDPYVFEFLGLTPREVFKEKDLENAILDNLVNFLLELGNGFCFEARQKRILIDNQHYFIDLVFYHRKLHCNVLIDLKTERFNHQHAGQMNMYLEYYKKYEMSPQDNPPVGILLCTDKDEEHVQFATAGMDDKVFVSKYLVALPGKKELERLIKEEINKL